MSQRDEKRRDWLDSAANVTRVFYALLAICLVTVALEPFFRPDHPHYPYERWIGFHAAFGFVAFVAIVMAGKQLRRLVGRGEDYYDR